MTSPRIVLIGATGFIGRKLIPSLFERFGEIVVVSRKPDEVRRRFGENVFPARWDDGKSGGWGDCVDGAAAVVNLAGDSLSTGRWTGRKRRAILESRVDAGRAVVEAIRRARVKPGVLVQASAVGYYGSRGDGILDESARPGQGFLADVCRQWEASTAEVEGLGVRRVVIRSGVVLGREGGALPAMALPFRFLAGGPVGLGRRWFSWIHVQDEVGGILFLLDREAARGAFNLAARPVREREFARSLGRALKRPSLFPAPVFVLKTLFGLKAKETILVSQRVVPARLEALGFRFQYPQIDAALGDIYSARG